MYLGVIFCKWECRMYGVGGEIGFGNGEWRVCVLYWVVGFCYISNEGILKVFR